MNAQDDDVKEMSPEGVRIVTWVFFFIGFLCLLFAVRDWKEKQHYLHDATRVRGTIIATESVGGTNPNEYTKIVYREAKGEQKTFRTQHAVSSSVARKGKSVEVLYFRGVDGSEKALYEVESRLSTLVLGAFCLGLWFFVGLFVNGLAAKHHKGWKFLFFQSAESAS
ncbi:MAG TPA: DUF3592 domain-containing protein [Phycisphaerales bacterium]|nr:DUF3592 domain-containing protein [Phycisphaerales bacterium]